MSGNSSLVLDTNVVRHIGAGDVDPTGLHEFKAEGGIIQLGDSSISELTHQLATGGLLWQHWVSARLHLQNLVPENEPILSLHKAGIFKRRQKSQRRSAENEIRADEEYYDAGWTLLLAANSALELGSLGIHLHVQGVVMSLPEAHIAREHRAVHDRWHREFLSFRASMLEIAPNLIKAMPRHDSPEAFEVMVDAFSAKLDEGCLHLKPLASSRLDAYIRVKSLLRTRHLRPKDGYNAEKNVNDYFDTELLKYLAMPAGVCTSDKRLINLLEQSDTWQRKWVVTPEDLRKREVRDALKSLEWPTV